MFPICGKDNFFSSMMNRNNLKLYCFVSEKVNHDRFEKDTALAKMEFLYLVIPLACTVLCTTNN